MRVTPAGFTFSPGGLLFPYYIGVAYFLQDAGYITPASPVGGSSAGAIIATAIACRVELGDVCTGLAALVRDVRRGTRLNPALRKQLEQMLPDDAADRAMAHHLAVGYLRVTPWPKPCVVTEWTSKADLINTVCASCNWPLYFSRWPFVWCRGQLALDGFFSVRRERFGCPPLKGADGRPPERTVAVCCLPIVKLSAFDGGDIIQPGLNDAFTLNVPAKQWFKWALTPATDETLEKMMRKGREHAMEWVQLQGDSG
ncbi:hypothetical protein AB1Y20_014850 [Prymnesium parvum]|uniref:PNPLA domain-containing protein n=1 Tax=Prymnesium parvum TaxID=97485 RepID=A0AB34JYZ3_PRYPA